MCSLRPDQRDIPGLTVSPARHLSSGQAVVKVAHPAFGGRELDVDLENLATSAGTSLKKRLDSLTQALARGALYARLRHPVDEG